MSLSKFLIRRTTYSIFVLLGLSVVIFIIARIMPGDPARMAVGARAPQWVVDRIRTNMHLDQPIPVQYYYWLRDALQGDFGLSLVTQRPVTQDVKEFLPASFELVFLAAIISSIAGIGLGILSARYKDTWIDNAVRLFSYTGIVTPSFVFAILFVLLFGFTLDWFPIIGRLSENLSAPPVRTGMVTVDALSPQAAGLCKCGLAHGPVALALAMARSWWPEYRSSMADNRQRLHRAAPLGIPERMVAPAAVKTVL
jgi:peptide/nickel transport system permease protein